MQPLFEHRLRFAGCDTRVLELEGEGPPVVLLHGYADSADTWRLLLAHLGREDRRAIAVDMPGFGTASPLEPGPVLPQLDRFAGAVVDYAAAADKVVLCGNSLGGCVAMRAASDGAPLAGVVPIAPAGLDMARWLWVIEREPILRSLLALPTPVPERAVREAVGQVYRMLAFARPRKVAAEVISGFTSHHRDRESVRRYLDTAHRLLPELADPFRLAEIRCPVMLVWGTRDRLVSAGGARRVVEALPATRVELLEGCGHCPQIEEVERVAELLREFPPALPKAA